VPATTTTAHETTWILDSTTATASILLNIEHTMGTILTAKPLRRLEQDLEFLRRHESHHLLLPFDRGYMRMVLRL
jgi:hypothetical protein